MSFIKWLKRKELSKEAKRMEELDKESAQRLEEAKKLSWKVEKVTNNLMDKNRRNGWGEVIAETMRRAEH